MNSVKYGNDYSAALLLAFSSHHVPEVPTSFFDTIQRRHAMGI